MPTQSRSRPLVCATPLHFLPDVHGKLRRDFALTVAFGWSAARLSRALRPARAFIPNPGTPFRLGSEVLGSAERLEILVTPSTGTDHIDLAFCRKRGIVVRSLRDRMDITESIHASAEFSLTLLLGLIRRLPAAAEAARRGVWREAEDRFRGIELAGKTVALIGYGRIGRKMAGYLRALGAKLVVYDPHVKVRDPWACQVRSLELALAAADIVSLHLHLDDSTRGLFGAKAFSRLRRGAYLVNTSRGGLVDEPALLRALRSGRLAGAAVDVVQGEQGGNLADRPLMRYARIHPALVVTPHIAGLTVDSQRKAALFAVSELRRHFGLKDD